MYVSGTSIDENGAFSIGGLKPGAYALRANPSPDDMKNGNTAKEIQIFINQAGLLADSQGQAIDPPNKQIQFAAPQVEGIVKNPGGQLVSEGNVDVMKDYGKYQEWVTGVSVIDGSFAFSGLDDGEYILKAHPGQNSEFSESKNVIIKIDQNVFVGVKNGKRELFNSTGRTGIVAEGCTDYRNCKKSRRVGCKMGLCRYMACK
jgi:hypothetical protein